MSLEVRIKKQFPEFSLDIDFSAGNEVLGFLGASGCGKSLTLRCVAGVETPDEGRIVVNDRVFFDSEKGVNLSPQQRKTGLLFQNYLLFPNLTVAENVAAGLDRKLPRSQRSQLVASELKRFGLDGFGDRYPFQLSGGQQQRVALARMLAAKPGVLMLDEPFSALDAHLRGVLEQSMAGVFDSFEGTVLYVSHDIDEALRFCDRIAVVESGRIVETVSGDELVASPKTAAALKLSGCKNVTPALKWSERAVWLPKWGVELSVESSVSDDVTCCGVRASHIERACGPGENCFRMRVDRMSDSRFERMLLLAFIDRDDRAVPTVGECEDEMRFLHQHLIWRLPKPVCGGEDVPALPERGDEVWVRIPPNRVHVIR